MQQGWAQLGFGGSLPQGKYGDLPAYGGGTPQNGGASFNGNFMAPQAPLPAPLPAPPIPPARCKSCQRPLTNQEVAFSTVAPACSACQEKYEDGSYCRVCLKVWWPAENNMVGCDSCDFWIHDGCDFEAARILANGASDAEPYNCPMCRSSHQAQAQLAALADAEAALRRAQPRPPRTAFTLFTENMHKQYSAEELQRYSEAVNQFIANSWHQLPREDAEQYERVAAQEMLRYQADKALFDQLQAKYRQMHNTIESSGVQQQVYTQKLLQQELLQRKQQAHQERQRQQRHQHPSHPHPDEGEHNRERERKRPPPPRRALPQHHDFDADERLEKSMDRKPSMQRQHPKPPPPKKRSAPVAPAPAAAKRQALGSLEDLPERIPVVCHSKQGTFLVRQGRVICECEGCRDMPEDQREMSATHFESHAGAGTAKKWKSSLRIPAGALPEVPTGGPNLSVGKWLVLRGVDEEKVPKSRAPAAAAPRASARRSAGSGRRARYDWDSDVTSDEDPGDKDASEDDDDLLESWDRSVPGTKPYQLNGSGGGRGRGGLPGMGRGASPAAGRGGRGAGRNGLGGRGGGRLQKYTSISPALDNAATTPVEMKPRIGRPPKNPSQELVAVPPPLAPWLEIPSCHHMPVRVRWAGDRCSVCDSDIDFDNDQLVSCDKCNITVHQSCYGVPELPDTGDFWMCRACELKDVGEVPPQCCLCPVVGGALKPTTLPGLWAHAACMQWIPEVTVEDTKVMERVDRIQAIQKERWEMKCTFCRQRCGAKIQCKSCYTAYHPLCGRIAGLHMDLEEMPEGSSQPFKFVSYCTKHCTPHPELSGVTLEGEAAAAEQAAHYVPALNGLWNAQPFLPPPAAPLPECSSGCARAQPIKEWLRASHGTGMGCSSTGGFWIPTTMPAPPPALLAARKLGRARGGGNYGSLRSLKSARPPPRHREPMYGRSRGGGGGDSSDEDAPPEVALLELPEGVPERQPVVCGSKKGTFLTRTQRIVYEGEELSASRFEQVSGKGDAKKWKSSVSADLPEGPMVMMEWLDQNGLDRKTLTQLQENAAAHQLYRDHMEEEVGEVVAIMVDRLESALEPAAAAARAAALHAGHPLPASPSLPALHQELSPGSPRAASAAGESAARRGHKSSGPLRKADGRFMSKEEAAAYHARLARGERGTPTPEPDPARPTALPSTVQSSVPVKPEPGSADGVDTPWPIAAPVSVQAAMQPRTGVDSIPAPTEVAVQPLNGSAVPASTVRNSTAEASAQQQQGSQQARAATIPSTLAGLAKLFTEQADAHPSVGADVSSVQHHCDPGNAAPAASLAATAVKQSSVPLATAHSTAAWGSAAAAPAGTDTAGVPTAAPATNTAVHAEVTPTAFNGSFPAAAEGTQPLSEERADDSAAGGIQGGGGGGGGAEDPESPITRADLQAAAAELSAGSRLDSELLELLFTKLRRGGSVGSLNGQLSSAAGLQSARESLNLSKDDDKSRFLETLWAASGGETSPTPPDGAAPADADRSDADRHDPIALSRLAADKRVLGKLTSIGENTGSSPLAASSDGRYHPYSRVSSFGLASSVAHYSDEEGEPAEISPAPAVIGAPGLSAVDTPEQPPETPSEAPHRPLPSATTGSEPLAAAAATAAAAVVRPAEGGADRSLRHPEGNPPQQAQGLGAGLPPPGATAEASAAVHLAGSGSSDPPKLSQPVTALTFNQAPEQGTHQQQHHQHQQQHQWEQQHLGPQAAPDAASAAATAPSLPGTSPLKGAGSPASAQPERPQTLQKLLQSSQRSLELLTAASFGGQTGGQTVGQTTGQGDGQSSGRPASAIPPRRRPDNVIGAAAWFWFPDDQEWYAARVAGVRPSDGRHRVVYFCDSEEEWLDLAAEEREGRLTWADGPQPPADGSGPAAAAAATAATPEGVAGMDTTYNAGHGQGTVPGGTEGQSDAAPHHPAGSDSAHVLQPAAEATQRAMVKQEGEGAPAPAGAAVPPALDQTAVKPEPEEPPEEIPEEVSMVCGRATGLLLIKRMVVRMADGREISPTEFEREGGKGSSKKWKCTSRVDKGGGMPGITMAEWLIQRGIDQPRPDRPSGSSAPAQAAAVTALQARRRQGGSQRAPPASSCAAPGPRPDRQVHRDGCQCVICKQARRTGKAWVGMDGKPRAPGGAPSSAPPGALRPAAPAGTRRLGGPTRNSAVGPRPRVGKRAFLEAMPHLPAGNRITPIWELPTSRAYTPRQWAERGGDGAEGGGGDGNGSDDDARRLNIRERLAVCAATEKDRLVFGKSGIHGWGMFAVKPMKAGEMVMEYRGVLLRKAIADRREAAYRAAGTDCYLFTLNEEFVIDATQAGTIARFTNHCCAPSLYVRLLEVDGKGRLVFFAKNDLRAGEELTYDYRFKAEDAASKVPCNCGAPPCRGTLN